MFGFKQMKRFVLFVPFFIYIISHVSCQECGKHKTFNDGHLHKRLFGYILETWSNIKLHDCARWCLTDKRCVSFNHREEELMCELNYQTADSVDPKYLMYAEFWHHFNLDTWEEFWTPLCEASACPDSDRCMATSADSICYDNPPRCPAEYFQFHEKCYLYNETVTDWYGAMSLCNDLGATLGTVRNWQEQVFVVEAMLALIETSTWLLAPWIGVKFNTSGNADWTHQPDDAPIGSEFATWTAGSDVDGTCILITAVVALNAWTPAPCVATTSVLCERPLY